MRSRDYLRRAFEIDRRLQARYRRLKVLESRASGSYSKANEEMTSHPLYVKSRMEENAVKALELKDLIEEDENTLKQVRAEIKKAIYSIGNETYISLLDMRYLQYMSWDDICSQFGFCLSYVYRLHGNALELIHVPEDVQ
jgi:hypothetical protein